MKSKLSRHFLILLFIGEVMGMAKAEAQGGKPLQKSWTLIQSRSIKEDTIVSNVLYKLRFDGENMYVTLSRTTHEMPQPYSVTGNELKGRFLNYIIESITDSSLILIIPDNRKMYFLAQGYSPCGDSLIKKVGEFNGHPYYKSTSYLMPTKSGEPLANIIEKAIHFGKQKQRVVVYVAFIVDENGNVQDAKITKSYSTEVDAIVLEQVQKSSGKWQPPLACGVPVATLVASGFVLDPVVHMNGEISNK